MIKKILIVIVFLLCLISIDNAQTYKKTELGVKIVIDSFEIEIRFYSPSIVRILKSPVSKEFIKESLSVIKSPQKTEFDVKQERDELLLESKTLQVNINLKSGKIIFTTPKKEILLQEKEHSAEFTDFNDAGINTFSIAQSYLLDYDEAIYGLGFQQQGKMIQRNVKLNMIQGNTDTYIPFFSVDKRIWTFLG